LDKNLTIPYLKNNLGIVVSTCGPNYSEGRNSRITVKANLGKSRSPIFKKRAGGMAQVVEHKLRP
jgi:hypothetical protein